MTAPLSKQIAWARMQARQHKRIAARYAGQPRARALALERMAVAEAAVATLEREQARRSRRALPLNTGA